MRRFVKLNFRLAPKELAAEEEAAAEFRKSGVVRSRRCRFDDFAMTSTRPAKVCRRRI
jgi:hypothetical protein